MSNEANTYSLSSAFPNTQSAARYVDAHSVVLRKQPSTELPDNDLFRIGLEGEATPAQRYEAILATPHEELASQQLLTNIKLAEFEKRIKELERIADTDSLTNVFNRRAFDRDLEKAIGLKRRKPDLGIHLLVIDMDGFKAINDTLGHDAGDLALQAVADKLNKLMRTEDTFARLGGDEFGIILMNTHTEGADVVKERVMTALTNVAFTYQEQEYAVRTSVGAMELTRDMDKDQAFKAADIMMYDVKRAKGADRHRAPEPLAPMIG